VPIAQTAGPGKIPRGSLPAVFPGNDVIRLVRLVRVFLMELAILAATTGPIPDRCEQV
jgi:hypothetical protein